MKKLLAALLFVVSPVFAQMPYTIKVNKETVDVIQADGITVTMPRSKPVVQAIDGEVFFTILSVMKHENAKEQHVLVLAVTQKYCLAGKGQVGVLTPSGTLLGVMPYDHQDTVAKFVGNYICKQAGVNGRTM